jgi:hypothetical protein
LRSLTEEGSFSLFSRAKDRLRAKVSEAVNHGLFFKSEVNGENLGHVAEKNEKQGEGDGCTEPPGTG